MKKKTFLYSALLLGSLSLSSCTDMLDKEPLDKFTDSPLLWNNPSSVEGYAATFYNLFTGYGNGGGSGDFYFTSLSDDQIGAGFKNWKYINVPASDSNWSSTWDEIRRANAMISSLTTQATDMDEATKNHWIGVARLMRGWQYWDLVRKFGDCTWLDHVPDTNDPLLYAARKDRDEIMDKVLEDLNFACNNIEDVNSQTTWSRNMANALKSQICLWEGTFRKYRTQEENGKPADLEGANRFLQACVEACEQIMPDYTLGSDIASYRAIYNSETLSGNSEIIFYKEYKKDYFGHSTINYTCSSTQMDGISKDAFDSFLFLDGKTAANTSYDNTDAGIMKLSASDGAQHLNIQNLLEVRDKRLGQIIDSVLCYQGHAWQRIAGGIAMTASSGYGICKFDNVNIDPTYRETSGKNYTSAPLYWLSVIYLDYAEAKAELGTITNDDLNKTINKLKSRAGLPSITVDVADAGDNDMGVSPLIWEIRRERRCELMLDNDFRYWDLIRWHQLDKLDTSKNPDIRLGANYVNDPECGLTLDGNYVDGYGNNERVYDKKHYLYPIPSGQITLNPNLEQNIGWK